MVSPTRLGIGMVLLYMAAGAQVIEFESNGLKYQTLTRRGVTIMFAPLPSHIHEFTILQVAVSNGSGGPYTIRPEDFRYVRADGSGVRASAAQKVVSELQEKGTRGDEIKLVSNYESALYGIANL